MESSSILNNRKYREFICAIACYVAVAVLISFFMRTLESMDQVWLLYDARRFHAMAEVIIAGFTPYIDYVDPKPPVLYATIAILDFIAEPGSLDLAVAAFFNVLAAALVYLIGREMYGFLSGFSAGLLFLIAVIPAQGYFLFSEQFAVFFLLAAFIGATRERFILAGLCIGIAMGFKQYAVLALVPALYLALVHERRHIPHLLMATLVTASLPFLGILAYYGPEALKAALYWTFGTAPAYITGNLNIIPAYAPQNLLSFTANLLAGTILVLPVLLFAAASVARHGFRTVNEEALALFAVVFLATILIRQYLHYWILVLPFLSLLACREFADRDLDERRLSEL